MCVFVFSGFNWTVGVIQKINDEATGSKTESKVPPLLEFLGPEQLKVTIAVSALSTRGQNVWTHLFWAPVPAPQVTGC